MNVILNENYSFEQLTDTLCDKVSGNRHFLRSDAGTGFIEFVPILPGVDFIFGELSINDPLMIKWDFKESRNSVFYLTHVESTNTETRKELNFNLAEEGTSLISQNNNRNILWLPKVKYKIIDIRFSSDWINSIDKTMTLPENAKSFINGHQDLMLLHVKKNGNIKQVANQIFKYKELVNRESQNIYLNSKTIELLLLVFNITLPIASEKKVKNTIHIDDYDKIIKFTNEFSATRGVPEKIENIANSMGMSRSKFQRVFKIVKGQTYYNFVLDVRMVKAMELLMENKSVTEVAEITGYSAISNFTTAFNNYYNILPGNLKTY